MTYRVSINASVVFSVQADDEDQALANARDVLAKAIPENFEMPGDNPNSVVCYVNGDFADGLEVESSWED
jgi:hypothetical protein